MDELEDRKLLCGITDAQRVFFKTIHEVFPNNQQPKTGGKQREGEGERERG